MSAYSVRATPDEKMRHLPGDDLIAEPLQSLTHAITVRCSCAGVAVARADGSRTRRVV
jgi:hypothetical protein